MLLNRKIVKDLRSILDDALNDNESLEQFIVEIGNANFNDTEVTFKVNLRLKPDRLKSLPSSLAILVRSNPSILAKSSRSF